LALPVLVVVVGKVRCCSLDMLKVLLPHASPAVGLELLMVASNGHVAGDGANNNRNEQGHRQDALNYDDNDTNHRSDYATQIEASVEGGRKSQGRNLAESEQVDHQSVQTSAFKWLYSDDSDQAMISTASKPKT
jgi:hypothetical protein